MPDGYIDGLLGVGSEYVTFSMNALDGTQHALSFWRNHLGFHIREISHLITNTPDYDLDRLNGKLRQLVGSPAPDAIMAPYDRLYSKVIRILAGGGLSELLASVGSEMGTVVGVYGGTLPSSPSGAVIRRLEEISSLADGADSEDSVTINGPRFPFSGRRGKLAAWGSLMVEQIQETRESLLSSQGSARSSGQGRPFWRRIRSTSGAAPSWTASSPTLRWRRWWST